MNDLDVHLIAIRTGDARAFGQWVAGCEFRLRASLSRFASRVDVEAVVQETLLRIWQVAPRFEPDGKPDSLVRFAIRVGRNVAISELRRLGSSRQQIEVMLAEPDAERVPAVEPDPMLREIIERCSDALPTQPAIALNVRLASGGGDSDRDLATRCNMKPNTFLQNVTRARKLLVQCLKKNGVSLEAVMR